MKVKIIKCSCDYAESSIDRFWYHDRIGEIFEVSSGEDDLLRVITSSGVSSMAIMPKDCIDLVDLREEKLNELGI